MDITDTISSYLDGMPDWLPFAIQAGGTMLRSRADEQVRQVQEQRMRDEMARQAAFKAQNAAALQAQIPTHTAPAQEAARTALAAKMQAQVMPQPGGPGNDGSFVPDNPGAPEVVKSDVARAVADALSKGRDFAKTTSNLSSYGGQQQANSITANRAHQDLNQVNSFSAGSSGVLPYELNAANRAGYGTRVASDVANGVGQIASIYSMMKPKKPMYNPGGYAGSQWSDGQ